MGRDGRSMSIWVKTTQCPHGCAKYFGSTVALEWHLGVKHEQSESSKPPADKAGTVRGM